MEAATQLDTQTTEEEFKPFSEEDDLIEQDQDEVLPNGSRIRRKFCHVCKRQLSFSIEHQPELCPYCNAKYWNKPRDERKLFILQDKYLESRRDSKYLGEMFLVIQSYAEILIKKRLRGKCVLKRYAIEEKASDAATKLIEQYLKRPTYEIATSFGSLLNRILNGVLYGNQQKREDKNVSLNSKVYGHSELGDNMERLAPSIRSSSSDQDQNSKDCREDISETRKAPPLTPSYLQFDDSSFSNILKRNFSHEAPAVIESIMKAVRRNQGSQNSILLLIVFKNRLFRKPHPVTAKKIYRTYGLQLRENLDKTEMVIREFLKEIAS